MFVLAVYDFYKKYLAFPVLVERGGPLFFWLSDWYVTLSTVWDTSWYMIGMNVLLGKKNATEPILLM